MKSMAELLREQAFVDGLGDDIVTLIAGCAKNVAFKPGDTIFREGENQPLEIKIVRAVIKVNSVKSDILAPGYAYLRITQFQERTGDLLKAQIKDLKKRSAKRDIDRTLKQVR